MCRDTENAVARAFAIAYLLTSDEKGAEGAVREAADCWNPEIDPKEALVLFSAVTAARMLRRDSDSMRAEQLEVVRLPQALGPTAGFDPWSRGCFVLRILMGLPLPVCAEMLGISATEAQERLGVMLSEMPHRLEIEQANS